MDCALTQFVVIRRDINDLRKMIDIGHACGEAFYKFSKLGLAPENFDVDKTTLVLKGARNENKLLRLEKQLIENKVPHAAIREPMSPWNGQLMAIGLVPGDRDIMGAHVNEFQKLVLGAPEDKDN